MSRRILAVAALAVVGSACHPRTPPAEPVALMAAGRWAPPGPEQASMEQLGSRLTYLTAAIRGAILDRSVPDSAKDREIVAAATQEDPSVAKPFDRYVVRVAREGKHALVLVCTGDGDAALLEDASCTPGLDGRRWESPAPGACEFTLAGTCAPAPP